MTLGLGGRADLSGLRQTFASVVRQRVSSWGLRAEVPGACGGRRGQAELRVTCLGPGPSGDPRPFADGLRVQADEDNGAIIQSAQDALKLIRNKFLPAVCSWVRVRPVGGAGGPGGAWGGRPAR